VATLSFDGETHDEIVAQVRTWLASAERPPIVGAVADAVSAASDMTRDALTVIAKAAPEPMARNEVLKALMKLGHDSNEATKRSTLAALDALSEASDGTLLKRVERARNSVVYEMNAAVARQLLGSLRR
jgi:predicted transcriptional regulator